MIIGLRGKAGAGKDEFARVAERDFGAIRVAFGDTLKEEVRAVLTELGVQTTDAHFHGTQQDKEQVVYLDPFLLVVNEQHKYLWDFIAEHGKSEGWLSSKLHGKPKVIAIKLSTVLSKQPPVVSFTIRELLQWYGTEYRRATDEEYWIRKVRNMCMDKTKLFVLTDCRYPNELAVADYKVHIVRKGAARIVGAAHSSETLLDSADVAYDLIINNDGSLGKYQKLCNEAIKMLKRLNNTGESKRNL